MSDEPSLDLILAEAARPGGRRAFHPVRRRFAPVLARPLAARAVRAGRRLLGRT